jgi:hypothetical protein
VAAIASLGFDAIYVGRALSILATVAIVLAIMALVRQLGASCLAAALAGLWFLATMARFFHPYMGMNDPNLLAVAIAAWALVWMMQRLSDGRAVEPAILLMAVAGFYKHNVAAIPLTALIWLGLVDRRLALRAVVVGAAAVLLGLAICGLIWGDAFFTQLFTPRNYSFGYLWRDFDRLRWIAPALVIFVVWVRHDWQHAASRFATLFVTIAFVLQCVEKLGAGVGDNSQFELAIASAVGLGLAFDRIEAWPAAKRWGADRSRLTIVVVLIVRLLVSTHTEPYLAIASPAFRALVRERAALAEAEAARIRAIPGPVACSIAMVCRMAGKSYRFDEFNVDQKLNSGKLTRDELTNAIAAQHLRLENVDGRTEAEFQ